MQGRLTLKVRDSINSEADLTKSGVQDRAPYGLTSNRAAAGVLKVPKHHQDAVW